jgi:unsaturated rhamnogalacturonyl hydrolase
MKTFLIIFCTIAFIVIPEPGKSQSKDETKAKLTAIAHSVLSSGVFQVRNDTVGIQVNTYVKAPLKTQLRLVSPYNDWRYWNGVLNIAMINLGNVMAKAEYSEFAERNIAFGFENAQNFEKKYNGEGKWNYPFGQFFIMEELDDCGAIGASVIEAYKKNPDPRYKAYIEQASKHILTKQSRLGDGTLVRSFPEKWSLWADDLYMSISFLSRRGEQTGDKRYFDDAVRQVINFHKYLFDSNMGLMTHCWYSDIKTRSVAFWGRANGWALIAQVDLLDRLPKNHPQRKILLSLLHRHILGISQYQSANGLWHQLLDKQDSFFETSCSAMFTYAIARAVNKGYIEFRYASIAKRGWEGVMTKISPAGDVEGVCTGTAVSNDLVYYYTRPTPLNDVHGLGTILLAGAEVLQLPQ